MNRSSLRRAGTAEYLAEGTCGHGQRTPSSTRVSTYPDRYHWRSGAPPTDPGARAGEPGAAACERDPEAGGLICRCSAHRDGPCSCDLVGHELDCSGVPGRRAGARLRQTCAGDAEPGCAAWSRARPAGSGWDPVSRSSKACSTRSSIRCSRATVERHRGCRGFGGFESARFLIDLGLGVLRVAPDRRMRSIWPRAGRADRRAPTSCLR